MNNEKNLTEQFNATTEELIKKLSGKGSESGVKLIDNVMSFVGMAGGCGTSFIVSNLAYLMANKYNLQVLVIDLNITYPIQYTYFNGKIAREKPDLVSFLLGKNEIGDSIDTKHNLSILYSSDRYLMDLINCDTEKSSANFSGLIDNIKYLFDVILIDCPMQLEHDLINAALFKSDAIYTVWSESLSCIANANRFISNLSVTGIDNTKVRAIMNKRTDVQYASSTFKSLKYQLISVIPFDLAVIEADLQAQIYSKSGESLSKNAAIVAERLEQLTYDVLVYGGYKPKSSSKNKLDNKQGKKENLSKAPVKNKIKQKSNQNQKVTNQQVSKQQKKPQVRPQASNQQVKPQVKPQVIKEKTVDETLQQMEEETLDFKEELDFEEEILKENSVEVSQDAIQEINNYQDDTVANELIDSGDLLDEELQDSLIGDDIEVPEKFSFDKANDIKTGIKTNADLKF